MEMVYNMDKLEKLMSASYIQIFSKVPISPWHSLRNCFLLFKLNTVEIIKCPCPLRIQKNAIIWAKTSFYAQPAWSYQLF